MRMRPPDSMRTRATGFTLIEMIVVMAAVGLLLSLALPRYMDALERGKEQVLQHNLAAMREAIDKFYGDNAKYPERLEDLVERRYLRAIPPDPYTESATWIVVAPKESARGGVIDVRSTFTDVRGAPRNRAGDAAPGLTTASPLVEQEGGATQIVIVDSARASPVAGVSQ